MTHFFKMSFSIFPIRFSTLDHKIKSEGTLILPAGSDFWPKIEDLSKEIYLRGVVKISSSSNSSCKFKLLGVPIIDKHKGGNITHFIGQSTTKR